jgi:hypothetical protein
VECLWRFKGFVYVLTLPPCTTMIAGPLFVFMDLVMVHKEIVLLLGYITCKFHALTIG